MGFFLFIFVYFRLMESTSRPEKSTEYLYSIILHSLRPMGSTSSMICVRLITSSKWYVFQSRTFGRRTMVGVVATNVQTRGGLGGASGTATNTTLALG